MSYAQYGLTSANASSANHEKGIIKGPDGKFYKLDGFERQQKDGLDTDKGAAFKSGLEAAAKEASGGEYDPTTFNTATDVENALKWLDGGKPEQAPEPTGPVELSSNLAHAKARVQQHEEDIVSGKYTSDLYDMDYRPDGAQSFLNRYKSKLGKRLDNGNYHEQDYNQDTSEAATNTSKVASGANDNSVDTSYYARTGRDNRVRR